MHKTLRVNIRKTLRVNMYKINESDILSVTCQIDRLGG